MTEPSSSQFSPERLDFLAVLSLVPPVSVEDVKQAYLEKAKTAHPDRGGNMQQFVKLQEPFELATEYAKFKAGRMEWLSRWVEQYAEQEKVIEEIKSLGGQVEVKGSEVLTSSIGADFAGVLDKVTSVRLAGPNFNNEVVLRVASHRRMLAGLRKLELTDATTSAAGVLQLRQFETLRELDLTGTPVSYQVAVALLSALRHLETLTLTRTGIGWWGKTRLRFKFRGVKII